MRKSFLLIAMLLLSAAWVVAQSSTSGQSTSPSSPSGTQAGSGDTGSQTNTSSGQSNTGSGNASQSQTDNGSRGSDTGVAQGSKETSGSAHHLRGCLSGSAGNYTLTDASGKTYTLAGKTDKLSAHVGHEIEVRGSGANASGNSSATASSSTSGGETFNVKSVKMISSSCSAGSSSPSNK